MQPRFASEGKPSDFSVVAIKSLWWRLGHHHVQRKIQVEQERSSLAETVFLAEFLEEMSTQRNRHLAGLEPRSGGCAHPAHPALERSERCSLAAVPTDLLEMVGLQAR